MGDERNRRLGVGVSVLKVNSLSAQWRMSGRNEKNERTFISVLLHLSNYAAPRTSASLQAAKQKITQKTETVMSGRSHTSPCLSLSEYWKCMRWKLKVIKSTVSLITCSLSYSITPGAFVFIVFYGSSLKRHVRYEHFYTTMQRLHGRTSLVKWRLSLT